MSKNTKWGSRQRRAIARQGQRRHAPALSLEDMAPEMEAILPCQTKGKQTNIALDDEPEPEDTNLWANTNQKFTTQLMAAGDADQFPDSNEVPDSGTYPFPTGSKSKPTPQHLT